MGACLIPLCVWAVVVGSLLFFLLFLVVIRLRGQDVKSVSAPDYKTEEEKDKAGKEQNDFINQRLTWLGTFEGLLFVADHYATNSCLLPVVGIAIAISIGVGTYAANRALKKLERQAFQKEDSWFLKHVLVLLMPGTAIPLIIGFAWLVLLAERLCPHLAVS